MSEQNWIILTHWAASEISMADCPSCHSTLCEYKNNEYLERICWNCGYYDSNSPAFKAHPEFFRNIVRENPSHFMKMFLEPKASDNGYHEPQNRRKVNRTQFGNLYLYSKDSKIPEVDHCYSVTPWVATPKENKEPFDLQELLRCIRNCPQVEKADFANPADTKWEGNAFDPHIRWHFKPPIVIELNIPFKDQTIAQMEIRDLDLQAEELSRFTVFYDGSCYMIVAKAEDMKKRFLSAPDVRDFLTNLLGEKFKTEEIPPSPLQQKYYLLFLSGKKEDIPDGVIETKNWRRLLVPQPESRISEKEKVLLTMFSSSRRFLDVFYAGCMIAQNMERKYTQLFKTHVKIQDTSLKFLGTPSYHLLKKRKMREELEKSMIEHYKIILDYAICLNLIKESKNTITELAQHSVFSRTSGQLIEIFLRYYHMDSESFTSCLEYTKQIVERSFSWRLASYAVVFGGISALIVQYGPTAIDMLRRILETYASGSA